MQKNNSCYNCKYCGKLGHKCNNEQKLSKLYQGYDAITGIYDYKSRNNLIVVRNFICNGKWFTPKRTWLKRIINLFV